MSTATADHEFPPARSTQAVAAPPTEAAAASDQEQGPAPAALRVRVNLVKRIYEAFSLLGRARRGTLIVSSIVSIGQVIAFSVVLGISAKDQCDEPLRAFLIMTVIKVALNYPLTVYHALTPIRPTRRDTEERRDQIERSRRIGSQQTDLRVRKFSDLTSLFGLILFILGNWWFFSSSQCRLSSPPMYWSTLTALIFSWLYFLEIFLIIVAVVFFLPLLLVGMRWAGVGEKKNEVGPLSKSEINSLPLKVYAGSLATETEQAAAPSSSDAAASAAAFITTTELTKPSKRNWSRLWSNVRRSSSSPSRGAKSSSTKQQAARPGENGVAAGRFAHLPRLPSNMSYVELPDSQSSCAICLCDYEAPPASGSAEASTWEPETLRVLPCSHAFHSPCLDSWLAISGRCALCQRPILDRSPERDGAQQGEQTDPAQQA